MAKFDDGFDQREQIRDAIDIVDLVERYVPLRRQGANFVGRCPWHDDSRPSLQVNATRQTFKCWVCNIGGDVFSFMMKIENVDFKESMQLLADMAGIELRKRKPQRRLNGGAPTPRIGYDDPGPHYDAPSYDDAPEYDPPPDYALADQQYSDAAPTPQPGYQPTEISKPVLYKAMEWLAGKYRDALLHSPEAEEARQYVRDRGLSEQSSDLYQIGYAPLGYDTVLEWIGYDRNRVRILEAAGVLAYREDYDDRGRVKPRPRYEQTPKLSDAERRKYYDRFRGRLMFPIRDVQDRVVAFGGRLLPNTTLKSPAKYVNSPETPIFHKSKMLYGLDRARNAIRQSGLVLVTEGYTDCIITSQFGFENVVAVLGTALGSEHVRILKRFASKMILLLDGDGPGQRRASEVLRFFVEHGVDMSVLTLPDDNDPCEFLQEKGPDAFRELLEHGTVDALDHAFKVATQNVDLNNDVVGSAKALDSLLDIVALFPEEKAAPNDPARLRMLGALQRFATRFRVSESELRRQIAEKRSRAQTYSDRAREREERYERRMEDEVNQSLDAPVNDENSPEAQIARYRQTWIYPVAGPDAETDEQLRSLFPPFEAALWGDQRFMPSPLECEYLEFWFAAPAWYPELVANVTNEDLRSPITRQLDQLGRDCLERGEEPTYDRIFLRYEDERMRNFLIDLESAGSAKGLDETAQDAEASASLLREILAAFERVRLQREAPRTIGFLREKETTQEQRQQALLEILRQAQERQRRLAERDNPGK